MVRSACRMLLWQFKMAQIWNQQTDNLFSLLKHAQAALEHTEQPTTQFKKRLIRRR